jgi:TolB-like protein/TPR repeat protein
MFTDIVGYTSLSQKDEALAMQLLEEHRKLVRPFFPKHNGREVKTMGDAFLVEFASALEAVRCAFDIQQSMHEMNNGRLPEKQVQLRIGVHVGDVIHSQNDVYGDAVNVANRIFPLAMPGGICVSEQVYGHVKNKFEFPLTSIGRRELKNVGESMEVYKVVMPWEQSAAVETPAYGTNRIAILPFRNMSPDPNDEFFAEGMTEEIISTVSGISGLDVISRTSVMGYKGTVKKVEDIGKELKVGSVLEGSFRKAGNRIRVTTQLIEVARDRHLWAQNYDRNLDDVFEVQSDVAKQVAEALRVRILSPEKERIERRPTQSTTAYTLYLKGRYHWNKRGIDDLNKAMEYFELAVHEDPNFALGYVGQADCAINLRQNWGADLEANHEKTRAMAAKALQLDPELAEAHTSMGGFFFHEYDLPRAEEEFRRAIELKPSYATAHQWYYFEVLAPQLRWDEALEQIEKAVELDPLSPMINLNHGYYYFYRKDYAKAIEWYKRVVELGFNPAHGDLAFSYGKMKMFDDMRREYATLVKVCQDLWPHLRLHVDGAIAYLQDDREAYKRLLTELESHFGEERGPDALVIADGCFYLGEKDKGFEWLERSYARKEPNLTYIKCDEFLDGVRTDPRYLGLLKRLGLD